MQREGTARRSYGSGSIFEARGAWYGKWRVGDRQVKRKLGPKREPGSRDGLTRKQAEAALRRLMGEVVAIAPEQRLTFQEAGERYLHHVEHVMQRKRATVQDYRIFLDRHLGPHFGSKPLDRIAADDVLAFFTRQARAGHAANSIRNRVNFAHSVFAFAQKRGWCNTNPVALCDRPRTGKTDPDIRYLNREELDALLRAVPADQPLGEMEAVLYLTAAMTGLRQGELIALRWRDVDWLASLIRVRRSYTRRQWGTPKSRRSSRAVPLADRVAADLERHFQRSAYQHDDDLVFCHPETGGPYDASKLRKRFKRAVERAGVRPVRFHDLRHTFGTQMAAVGTPMRTLQEWMGHADFATTLIYADFAPDPARGAALVAAAFGDAGTNPGTNASETGTNSEEEDRLYSAESGRSRTRLS
jgi:integrase